MHIRAENVCRGRTGSLVRGAPRYATRSLFKVIIFFVALYASAAAYAEVVYLPTQAGAERFRRSASEPEALALFAFVETQTRVNFCGPASLASALNSLGIDGPTPAPLYPYRFISQDTVFTPENQSVKRYADVDKDGMTLYELSQFAANLQVSAEIIYGLDVNEDVMRQKIRAALRDKETRVLVNYSRSPLGQGDIGHISPIAAYDADTDSFLILDVALYKYPPAWVSFQQLLEAMRLIDSSSGKSRGALIISKSRTFDR